MENNKKKLFRKNALEHLSVTQQLNERINITSRWSWLMVMGLALICISIIIWGLIGSIPTRVEGQGILLATKGSLYNAVAPVGNGQIISIDVKQGDYVNKDDIIAHLATPDLEEKITAAKTYLARLQIEYADLQKQFKIELLANTQQVNQQDNISTKILLSETEHLKEVIQLLDIKKKAYQQGILTKQDVAQSYELYYQTKNAINQAHNALEENKIKKASFVSQWKDKLNALELKAEDQQYQLNDLIGQKTSAKVVKAPTAGVITMIQSSIGDTLTSGQVVATIATSAKNLDAVVYVPAQDGKRIKIGMSVLISPTTIKKEEFGSIKATVTQVSPFPSTSQSMLAVLQNDDLVKEFSKGGVSIAVRIHLETNPKTYSGYTWTSSTGPEQNITAGTLVKSEITVRNQAPVTLIIPAIKRVTGS